MVSKNKRSARRAASKAKKQQLKAKALEIKARNVELEKHLQLVQAESLAPKEEKKGEKTKEPEPVTEEVEYVPALNLDEEEGPMVEEFKRIYEAFNTVRKTRAEIREEEEAKEAALLKAQKKAANENEDEEEEEKPLSRKQLRLKGRLSIAELKQLVDKPEIVDIHDCNSNDPKLLVMLKSYRNTAPVPRHWLDRRKYLQNKRGIEKLPFELPHFIADTGIGEIRQTQVEKAEAANMKQSARNRMRPKQGKMDIDYHVLHDAFFVHQTKPSMTLFNDLYYEGKEYEAKMKKKRPGQLSEELMRALGMVDGYKSPAPWLFNMQRFGPPPSYPSLKIPGVNWPIPEGCNYGTMEGQWGKPPVDEYGRPLYGDVFGTEHKEGESGPLEVALWGSLQPEEERTGFSSDEEPEDDEENEDMEDEDMDEDAMASGTESQVSGLSTPSGLTTPDGSINVRREGTETPEQKSFYRVIEEKSISMGGGLFPSDHTYVLPQASGELDKKRGQVDLALNPDELDNLDAATLAKKYKDQLKADASASIVDRSELDQVIEEENRRAKKRKGTGGSSGSSSKKSKSFKF